MRGDVWPQVAALARRSVVRTSRQPAAVVFPLIFPMLLLLVNSGGLKASTKLPGFPTDSFLAFALAVPFIQGALFSTMNAGTDLAKDIQTGFLNRLSLTSMRGVALMSFGTGRLNDRLHGLSQAGPQLLAHGLGGGLPVAGNQPQGRKLPRHRLRRANVTINVIDARHRRHPFAV